MSTEKKYLTKNSHTYKIYKIEGEYPLEKVVMIGEESDLNTAELLLMFYESRGVFAFYEKS